MVEKAPHTKPNGLAGLIWFNCSSRSSSGHGAWSKKPEAARIDGPADLEDGKAHDFEWRRDKEGNMLVLLDGNEVIRTVDRTVNDFFDGFTIANAGGDYIFELLEIFGTAR